jgi:hypothetical protein
VAWRYEVRATSADGVWLRVEATFAAATASALVVDSSAAPFVRNVQFERAGQWVGAAARQGAWVVACPGSDCRVRYAFALGEAAAAIDDEDTAFARGGAIVAPPSTWLLRPETDGPYDGRFRFHVTTDPGSGFATGIRPSAAEDGAFEAPASAIDAASFAIFGAIDLDSFRIGSSAVEVATARSGLSMTAADVGAWVRRAAEEIGAFYDRFPATRTLVIVVPGTRPETTGETLGEGGPSVLVRAARGLTATSTRDDWVLTHELIHATLPTVGRSHAWLEEGLATYLEPLIRARAGLVSEDRFWRDLVDGLSQGLPAAGDEGLERTHTWGRTYWGGALFCFLADLRIRESSGGERSLQTALQGVAATGADVESRWTVAQFISVADAASRTTALSDLYRELAFAPTPVDLANIWSRLGIATVGAGVVYDDGAPLAPLRRAWLAASRPQRTAP